MSKNLSKFIDSERNRFENRHDNMFSFVFSDILIYYDYLQIILERYQPLSLEFVKNTKEMHESIKIHSGTMDAQQMKLMGEGRKITKHLHLEIESFYLFAKILLDKISQAIQFYFGPARSLSLASHDKLTKHIENYAKTKALSLSSELFETIKKLKSDISDFRDYQIQHIEEYRQGRVARGTAFDGDGNTKLSLFSVFPTEKDRQYESRHLKELEGEISAYIDNVIEFIEQNKTKTNLNLKT
ncbi:MAG: hypothetical protein HYW33_01005 [Candidatus Blackburnbacteria bacterium]|nr:hypothetical protein [Candidatus Blackburnbacteria bacterium]